MDADGELDAEAQREAEVEKDGLCVLLEVVLGIAEPDREALRLQVSGPLALRQSVLEVLIETLADTEGLPEALATIEGGLLPLGDKVELSVKDPLGVTVCEGDGEADGQRELEAIAEALRIELRETRCEMLWLSVGEPLALGQSVLEKLIDALPDTNGVSEGPGIDARVLLLGVVVGLVINEASDEAVCEDDGEADGQRVLKTDPEALFLGLGVTVGEMLRLCVSAPLALKQSVLDELIEALADSDGLLEALAATEGGLLSLGEIDGLDVSVPLDVKVCEGEPDADGQRNPKAEVLGVRIALGVNVGEALKLIEARGDREGQLETLSTTDGGLLPLGDNEALVVSVPLEVAVCEGEPDTEGHCESECKALGERIALRVNIGEALRLIEVLGDIEGRLEEEAATDGGLLPLGDMERLVVSVSLDVSVCEGEPDVDGQRDPESEALGVRVVLRVKVGDALRLRVGVPVALRHSVPEALSETLGDAEGLLEALATTEGGLLPLGEMEELVVKDPLEVTVCEGDGEADAQRELDVVTEALSVGLRVIVGEGLRLRVGVPVALRQSVPEVLSETLGVTDGLPEALAATEGGLLPL